MTSFNPSYLVQSRHGIWYFQIRIPKKIRKEKSKSLVRRSLKTRSRSDALSRSKFWYLKVIEFDYDLSRFNERESSSELITNKTLSECIEDFILEKKRTWSEPHSSINEHKDYRPKLSLLIETIGDRSVNKITKKDIVKYKNTLFKIPSNRHKKSLYKGKTINQLNEMIIPTEDLLSKTSIGNHFVKVTSFLSWLLENDLTTHNLSSPLRRVIKKDRKESELRSSFSDSDLITLFNNDYYIEGNHRNNSQFWIPILGLFTGARLNELCQLDRSDIVEIDGVWCIDINNKNDKKLKNLSSIRVIPIHSILLNELSFLEFVKSETTVKSFPELSKSRDGYGRSFSKWFNRTYRKNINIGQGEERKDFHSFRHTFANFFKQQTDVQEYRISEIMGHKGLSNITYTRYGKESSIESKKILIELIEYPSLKFSLFVF